MRCYFLRDNRIEGVEILPAGLSDEEAIARAQAASAKRHGTFDSLEVWEGRRSIFRGAPSTQTPSADPQPATSRLPAAE
jgi:hypothetical protein